MSKGYVLALSIVAALASCGESDDGIKRTKLENVYDGEGNVVGVAEVVVDPDPGKGTATGSTGGDIALAIALSPLCIVTGGITCRGY